MVKKYLGELSMKVNRFKLPLLYFMFYLKVIILSAVGYYFSMSGFKDGVGKYEGFLDALYFSIVTITTLGYGEITPDTGLAKLFVSFEVLFGLLVIGLFLNAIANSIKDATEEKSQSQREDFKNGLYTELLHAIEEGKRKLFPGSKDISPDYVYFGRYYTAVRIIQPSKKEDVEIINSSMVDQGKSIQDNILQINMLVRDLQKDIKTIHDPYVIFFEHEISNATRTLITVCSKCMNVIQDVLIKDEYDQDDFFIVIGEYMSVKNALMGAEGVFIELSTEILNEGEQLIKGIDEMEMKYGLGNILKKK